MPVLVTLFGGTGYLGSAIARALVADGARVRIAARHPRLPEGVGDGEACELASADIRLDADVAEALRGADAAINAVGLYTEPGPDETFAIIHAQGAGRVARLAEESGVQRLVHVSGIGADSQSPSPYIRARALGEQEVLRRRPDAVILRPSVLFGPEDTFLGALATLTRLPVVPLFGRGETRLQPVLVDDAALAASQLAMGAMPPGRVLELGGAGIYRYREIVTMVLAQFGRRRPMLSVPFPAWLLLAKLTVRLPSAPLTENQVMLMREDKVVAPNMPGFKELGIAPRSLEEMLEVCLARR